MIKIFLIKNKYRKKKLHVFEEIKIRKVNILLSFRRLKLQRRFALE